MIAKVRMICGNCGKKWMHTFDNDHRWTVKCPECGKKNDFGTVKDDGTNIVVSKGSLIVRTDKT